jgi:hypothetical protein
MIWSFLLVALTGQFTNHFMQDLNKLAYFKTIM